MAEFISNNQVKEEKNKRLLYFSNLAQIEKYGFILKGVFWAVFFIAMAIYTAFKKEGGFIIWYRD